MVRRTLSNNSFEGPLPPEWGWTPKLSLLRTLRLDNNPLSATLPSAWGSKGGFSSLQVRSCTCTLKDQRLHVLEPSASLCHVPLKTEVSAPMVSYSMIRNE